MAEASPSTAGSRVAPPAAVRVAEILREIARGGLAGLLAGTLVGGIGGRIAMSAAAVLNPQATGLRTENGELVGAFTLNGTLALIIFGGIGAGLTAGVIWVVISPWLPSSGIRRALLVMPIAAALGGFVLIEPDNPDFIILSRHEAPVIAMLVVLVGLIGAGIALADGWLDRHLPRPGANPSTQVLAYGAIALVGIPILILTLRAFFDPSFADHRPVGAGLALVATGVATVAWWVSRIVAGRADQPMALLVAGRIALVAAVILGGQFLLMDVADILDIA